VTFLLLLLLPSTRRTVCTSHEEEEEEPTHPDYYLMLLLPTLCMCVCVYYCIHIHRLFLQCVPFISADIKKNCHPPPFLRLYYYT
jgi:hypothetical protein